jgi:hypothetical protein
MKIVALYFALVAAWWVIVFKLVELGHMKTLILLLALFALQCPDARAQATDAPDGTPIVSAVVSGLDADRLSPALRREVDALAGTPLKAVDLDTLARRIEADAPNTVVAVRSVLTESNQARVIFLVAGTDGGRPSDENVNARYVVESVAVEGVPESRLSTSLRDDLHAVVGTRLSRTDARRLMQRLRDELPGYDVTRRMSRGSVPGRLRMVVLVRPGEAMRWLHFSPPRSKFLYHTDQGWTGVLDINIGSHDWRVSPFFALSNADDLVEEYDAYGIRIETRNSGTEELGFAIELATYDADWRDRTLTALSSEPGAFVYDSRTTFSPIARFAFTPHFHVGGGVSVTQLELDDARGGVSQTANAYVASAGYDGQWNRGGVRQDLDSSFELKAGSGTLESDFDYRHYFGRATYRVSWGPNTVIASGLGGAITGSAPIFERFTLGDSSTLRGWDKYDIVPAGGNRVGHGSVEYRNRVFAVFLDGGSVWSDVDRSRMRFSTGLGLHHDNFFATLAFPLNTSDFRTMFMIGVRF